MNSVFLKFLGAMLIVSVPLTTMAQEVRNREANQQGRIAQGINSGQITAGGASHLEKREQAINATRRADLAANAGHLTARESSNLNRRENSVSKRIYTDKHNDIAQPGVIPK